VKNRRENEPTKGRGQGCGWEGQTEERGSRTRLCREKIVKGEHLWASKRAERMKTAAGAKTGDAVGQKTLRDLGADGIN